MYDVIRTMISSPGMTLEQLAKALEPYDKKSDLPMNHFFGDNLYVRQAFYPKGSVILGRVHKYDHVFMLVSGKISVWTVEGRKILTGPCLFESKAGTQRIGYVHAAAVCINMHGAADGVELSAETAEDIFTVATADDFEAFKRVLSSQAVPLQVGSDEAGPTRAGAPPTALLRLPPLVEVSAGPRDAPATPWK